VIEYKGTILIIRKDVASLEDDHASTYSDKFSLELDKLQHSIKAINLYRLELGGEVA
jgi:hypothetical protein